MAGGVCYGKGLRAKELMETRARTVISLMALLYRRNNNLKTARAAEAAPSAPSAPWLPRPPSLAQAHHNRLLELCGTTVQTSRHLQLSRPTISRRYRPFKVHLLDASVHLLRALIPATNQQRVHGPQARVQVL